MGIYLGDKQGIAYKGDYKPVNIYHKDKKVAGWKNETQTGDSLTFTDTYNDTADIVIKGNSVQKSEWVHKEGQSEQANTVETITNPLSPYIIPFRCGNGLFDIQISGATNARWLYDGAIYTVERLQLTTEEDEIAWLLVDNFYMRGVTIENGAIEQPIKIDLADLQGKINHGLMLDDCTNVTGSLADLRGKITSCLSLSNCSNITGSLADLQGKITYALGLMNCTNVTGSLVDLQGKITTLMLDNCTNVTGSLADLQGKITLILSLNNCSNITGSLEDLRGRITYALMLDNCSNITGVYTPVGAGVPIVTYLSYTGLSASDMDATLIAYANASKDNGIFMATGMTRTAASDDAITTLTGRGWMISGITKVEL